MAEQFAFPTRNLVDVQDERIGIAESNGGQIGDTR